MVLKDQARQHAFFGYSTNCLYNTTFVIEGIRPTSTEPADFYLFDLNNIGKLKQIEFENLDRKIKQTACWKYHSYSLCCIFLYVGNINKSCITVVLLAYNVEKVCEIRSLLQCYVFSPNRVATPSKHGYSKYSCH